MICSRHAPEARVILGVRGGHASSRGFKALVHGVEAAIPRMKRSESSESRLVSAIGFSFKMTG